MNLDKYLEKFATKDEVLVEFEKVRAKSSKTWVTPVRKKVRTKIFPSKLRLANILYQYYLNWDSIHIYKELEKTSKT